jgi:hypothetical protein
MKFYEGGKETGRKYISLKDIDEVFPARKWTPWTWMMILLSVALSTS